MQNIMRFIDNGGQVIYLGNTAWRNVERVESGDYIWGDGILLSRWDSANKDKQQLLNKKVPYRFLTEYLGSYYDARGVEHLHRIN